MYATRIILIIATPFTILLAIANRLCRAVSDMPGAVWDDVCDEITAARYIWRTGEPRR